MSRPVRCLFFDGPAKSPFTVNCAWSLFWPRYMDFGRSVPTPRHASMSHKPAGLTVRADWCDPLTAQSLGLARIRFRLVNWAWQGPGSHSGSFHHLNKPHMGNACVRGALPKSLWTAVPIGSYPIVASGLVMTGRGCSRGIRVLVSSSVCTSRGSAVYMALNAICPEPSSST
jgi:hypothetical protein